MMSSRRIDVGTGYKS